MFYCFLVPIAIDVDYYPVMILGDNREECLKDNLKTLKIRVLWQEELAIEKYEDLDAFGVLDAYVATTENQNLKQPRVKAAMEAKRLA